jgi:hypothetical protein
MWILAIWDSPTQDFSFCQNKESLVHGFHRTGMISTTASIEQEWYLPQENSMIIKWVFSSPQISASHMIDLELHWWSSPQPTFEPVGNKLITVQQRGKTLEIGQGKWTCEGVLQLLQYNFSNGHTIRKFMGSQSLIQSLPCLCDVRHFSFMDLVPAPD